MNFADQYRNNLADLTGKIAATDGEGGELAFQEAVDGVTTLVMTRSLLGRKVIFIGNGGSAAIASHMAIDFGRNAGVRALSFNDGPLLTCLSNDFGYQHVFEKALEMSADPEDILFAVSSSGESENILRGVRTARSKGVDVVTLSGFREGNSLRRMGDINFHVPSKAYGPVEVTHHMICHCLLSAVLIEKGLRQPDELIDA